MSSRFLVPVLVSSALHALVLIVGPSSPPPPVAGPDDPALPPIERLPMTLKDPEEPEPVFATETPRPQGNPDALRPPSEEPPVVEPSDYYQAFEPSRPVATEPVTKIVPGRFGWTDGVGETWTDRPVFSVKHLDNLPRTRTQTAPAYPAGAKAAGLSGQVMVEFLVDESGRVSSPRVVESTHPLFEEPTLRAVLKWRFEPGRKNGRPVRFRMVAPVVFSLES